MEFVYESSQIFYCAKHIRFSKVNQRGIGMSTPPPTPRTSTSLAPPSFLSSLQTLGFTPHPSYTSDPSPSPIPSLPTPPLLHLNVPSIPPSDFASLHPTKIQQLQSNEYPSRLADGIVTSVMRRQNRGSYPYSITNARTLAIYQSGKKEAGAGKSGLIRLSKPWREGRVGGQAVLSPPCRFGYQAAHYWSGAYKVLWRVALWL